MPFYRNHILLRSFLLLSLALLFFAFFLPSGASADGQSDSGDPESSIEEIEMALVDAYFHGDGTVNGDVRRLLDELCRLSPDEGDRWDRLVNRWEHINTRMTINTDTRPSSLPDNGLTVIVVMGYQLNPRGSMKEELAGRCRVALNYAREDPNSIIIVTGGPTAQKNPNVSEADAMENWLTRRGIDRSRILKEGSSLTTYENAEFSVKLMQDNGIQPDRLLIVTSDYHIKRSCSDFAAAMVLFGSGVIEMENCACKTLGRSPEKLIYQGADIKNMLYSR